MSSSSSASATVRVEKATSDLLMGPDWTLNMDICDSVNSDNWLAKDVVKSVKKRLQHKNPKVQFLALTLLETMIKNCGEYVHFQVVEREILQEMVKIVRKKSDMQVRDKILVLLDSWQEAFGGAGGKYPQYYWAYADLRRSGVQFPERSPDSTLIFTPPVHATPSMGPQIGYGMPGNSALRLDEAMASEMANLSLSDLDSMQSVMELLCEMLKAVNPNDRAAVKDEVIVDLVSQCCSNQKKLLQSINSIRDEELLGRGLELNDKLQSLLAKHNAIASGSPLPAEVSESIPSTSNVPQPTTAEVSESTSPKTPIAPPPAAPSRYDDEEEDEDDDFAQLARRNSRMNPVVSDAQSLAAGNQLGSSSQSDITVSSVAVSMGEASSSASSNALTLPNPPTPVRTSTREQDIIEFLSITLSSTPSPPHTPLTPPVASDQNVSPRPVPPHQQVNNPQSPLSYPANQAYIPQNTFIAPWAQPQPQTHFPPPPQSQPQPQPQAFLNTSAYPPPPWAMGPANANSTANPNPFVSTTYQYPAPGASAAYSTQASRPQPQNTSLGSRVNNAQVTSSEAQATTITLGQTTTPSAKPYVYTKRLFDDLRDWRNPNTGLKTGSPPSGLSGTPGQGMVNGTK